MSVWIVWEWYNGDEDDQRDVAGVFDNENAARECESSPEKRKPALREVEHYAVQSEYTGERRMC